MRINTNLFWLRPGDWPLDAEGKVFLGRAVLALAESRFESPPMVAPLSPEAQAAYWKAADTIATEAAAGRLVTFAWNDRFSSWVPLRGGQWAGADRRKLFRALFWFPGEELRAPSFSESRWPVYVEPESLAKLTGIVIEQEPEPQPEHAPPAPAAAPDPGAALDAEPCAGDYSNLYQNARLVVRHKKEIMDRARYLIRKFKHATNRDKLIANLQVKWPFLSYRKARREIWDVVKLEAEWPAEWDLQKTGPKKSQS